MEDRETYLPSRLTLLKKKTASTLMVVIVGILVVVFLVSSDLWNSCRVQHLYLIDDIRKYEKTLDPEFCESLIHKIDSLNEQCNIDIETLDCG
jgi:hypothetical protein